MAKTDGSKKKKSESTPEGGDIHVGGSVIGNDIIIGHNNVIHKYYQIIEKNNKQNDPDFWNLKHPYPMPPNFTGRMEERALLTQWLDGDSENRLFILRALGGFGKSALAWQWLTHDVNPEKWKKVVFWSFYEGDASFEHFVEETLKYLRREVTPSKRDQVDELLKAMQADNILLIMDGFERVLRAYSSMNAAYRGDEEPKLDDNQLDCTDLNAEIFLKSICSLPKIQSKSIMTTRLTPRALKPRGEFMVGCCETELTAMQKTDAVEFFHKQGVKGNRVEIESACEPYGYHPLSLRLLAGRILKDFKNPGDISVALKLKIDGDIMQQKRHVLEVSYSILPVSEQKLLSTIACFRSPVELEILESIDAEANHASPLHDQLQDLINRGLLYHDSRNKKFDLHPVVRNYAYRRLSTTDRIKTHTALSYYFTTIYTPSEAQSIEDLTPKIEMYHHLVMAEKRELAFELLTEYLTKPLYFQFGAYQTLLELVLSFIQNNKEQNGTLINESEQSWALSMLATTYNMSGQPRYAAPLLEKAIKYANQSRDKKNLLIRLNNLAQLQLDIGELRYAEHNLKVMLDICHEIKDNFWKAVGHQELGRIQSYLSKWQEAEFNFSEALIAAESLNHVQNLCLTWSYRTSCRMLMYRESKSKVNEGATLLVEFATRALKLAEETAQKYYPFPRDFVRAHWLLGSSYFFNIQLDLAEQHLNEALIRDRMINMVDHEANILLDIARLRYAQGDFKDAQEKASEALMITERSGYVLQGADVNLFLAQYALEQEKDNAKAKEYALEAKKLATCDGPPYYYKVAYDEAVKMLESLKV